MLFGYEIPWLDRALLILLVIVVALVARWLLVRAIGLVTRSMVDRAQRRKAATPAGRIIAAVTGADNSRYEQRAATMGSLLRSVVAVGVFTVTVLTILAIFDVPLGPLLATAGVGGVALGFGAQSLVRDYLSGMFMIMEDQYGVGDVIDTGQVTGTVEEVGLRVTRLRDGNGQVWSRGNGAGGVVPRLLCCGRRQKVGHRRTVQEGSEALFHAVDEEARQLALLGLVHDRTAVSENHGGAVWTPPAENGLAVRDLLVALGDHLGPCKKREILRVAIASARTCEQRGNVTCSSRARTDT